MEVVKTVAPQAGRREAGMRLDIPKPRAKACAVAGRLRALEALPQQVYEPSGRLKSASPETRSRRCPSAHGRGRDRELPTDWSHTR